ncbi:MAG: serine/threonine-protein kinase [Myxococcota bacterium]
MPVELIRPLSRAPWLETHLAKVDGLRLVWRRLLDVEPELIAHARLVLPRAAELRHPAFATLVVHRIEAGAIEFGQTDVGERSLGRLAGEGSLPVEGLVLMARDAALALAAALASTGLSHGALRPTKLRLLESGELVVVGLGTDLFIDAHRARHQAEATDAALYRRGASPWPPATPEQDTYALARIVRGLLEQTQGSAAQRQRVVRDLGELEAATSPGELADRLGETLRGLRRLFGSSPATSPRKRGAFDLSGLDGGPSPTPPRRSTAVFEDAEAQPTQAESTSWTDGGTETDRTRPVIEAESAPPQPALVSSPSSPSSASSASATAEEAAMIGQILHGFRLEAPLSSGTYGHVFLGVHTLLGHVRAIKVVRAKFTGNEWVRRRVIREAERLLSLRHENLVEVHDLGLTPDQRPFIVMELLEGRNLAEIVRGEGPRPSEEAMFLVKEIARGLEVLHQHGIVHRDLKPANVMLVDVGGRVVVKVLDLGVARAAGEAEATQLTRANELVGTPAYMAPEQIEEPSAAGPAADQYALGALWYALLSGAPPFTGDPYRVIERQRREAPAPLPVPEWPWIARLLAKEPGQRFQSVSELRALLEARLAPAPPPPITPAWTQRLLLGAVVSAVLALCVAVGWSLSRESALPLPSSSPSASPSPSPSLPPAAASAPPPPPVSAPPESSAPTATPSPAEVAPPRPTRAPPRASPTPSGIHGRTLALAWLRTHHLRVEDLPALLPAGHGLDDPSIEEELERARITAPLLSARLERLLQKLRRASSALPLDDIAPIEQRYLGLKKRAKVEADLPALNLEVDALELDLDRALGG